MQALIIDIPTTEIYTTKEFSLLSDKLKQYRLHDQDMKLSEKQGIKFPAPRSYNRGLLCIAAVLEKGGVSVDYQNSDYDPDFWGKCQDRIVGTDLLLFSAKSNNYPEILALCRKAKQLNPEITTILGGPHPTALPKECASEEAIDYLVLGEGEATVQELLSHLKTGSPQLGNIPGLAWYQQGEAVINKLRCRIQEFENYPIPSYHLLPGGLNEYHPYIETSRGCSYNCGFCSGPGYWQRRVVTRSLAHFKEELSLIDSLLEDSNLVHISDPAFGCYPKQAVITDYLSRANLDLMFSCDVKANYVEGAKVRELLSAGVRVFSIGIETLNNKALALLGKNCSAEAEVAACKEIKKSAAAYLKSYWIVGLPGEDPKSLEANNRGIKTMLGHNVVDQVCNHLLVPYPGTDFFSTPEKYGIRIKHHDWAHYEGRSFPLVYELENISSDEIYEFFLQANESELDFYQEEYPNLRLKVEESHDNSGISFGRYKGNLL
ncbi:B12-binding domain-containing radical SAM protein [Patescibacteria group bacterium]